MAKAKVLMTEVRTRLDEKTGKHEQFLYEYKDDNAADVSSYKERKEGEDLLALEESRSGLLMRLLSEAVRRINQIMPSINNMSELKSMEDMLANLPKVDNAPIDKAIAIRTVYEKESKKVESMKQEKIDTYDVGKSPKWPV